MATRSPRRRLTRREFLIAAQATLAVFAAGCGRRAPASEAPSPTRAPQPTSTPVPPATPPAAVATATLGPSPVPLDPAVAADLVLTNGRVITIDAADTIAHAVAVKNGLLQAVGTVQEIGALAGPSTQVIDLAGRALTPGLIDPHNHFHGLALMGTVYVDFIPPDVRSFADLQAKLAEVVAEKPAGEWVMGYYLAFTEGRPPERGELDAAAPDHPVFLFQQGGHFAAVNSAALAAAGITAATADPVGGIIARDATGEPTGVLYNHRAMDLVRRVIPTLPTPEDLSANLAAVQPIYAACGVTSFQDNNVRGPDYVHAYLEAGRQGQMTLRGAVYYTLEWPADLDRALHEVERYDDPYMRMAGFKFLIDGQAPTAYCHAPHSGVSWDMPTWDPAMFKETVRALHDTGLQICVHCVGDAAVDLVLDAYEEAMNANPRPDPRHRIEHCILCTPDAIRRMADLGVVVSTQPQFLRVGGDYWGTIFGPERLQRAIVTREWLDAGVHLALGSDAPTTPWYTPQITLAGACTRLSLSNQVVNPSQRLTIQEALRAHTLGAAYAAHEEHLKGSIEAGKVADLVVWHDDPYALPDPTRLASAKVDMTLVGGKVVYQSE